MGRLVSVSKSLIQGVQLPNQHPYNVGDHVVLSNEEFAVINPASYGADAVLTDLGAFPLVNLPIPSATGPGDTTSLGAHNLSRSDTVQVGNPQAAARTNLGRFEPTTDVAAALITQQVVFVAVFLEDADVVTNVVYKVGATAANTPSHQFVALYSPAGALLHQSADGTTTARAANATVTTALTAPYTVPAGAGGVYFVGIGFTATTVPSVLSRVLTAGAEAGVSQLTGTAPLARKSVGGTYTTTAPATIAGATGLTASLNVPLVVLT